MGEINLVLAVPHGIITATSLGLAGYAKHRSPGSNKYFRGKMIMIDLALETGRPAFNYFEEGGWRDAMGDTVAALAAVQAGKRTKTALSNDGFNVTPLTAYKRIYLVKTGGALFEMAPPIRLLGFVNHACHEDLTPDQVARSIGRPSPAERAARLLLILEPIQFLVMTNLTLEEYAWYATHRPGKIFRQVMFTELDSDQPDIAAASRFSDARELLSKKPYKKTKVIAVGECLNDIPFRAWIGYRGNVRGGLYIGDRNRISLWPFPAEIPESWDKLNG